MLEENNKEKTDENEIENKNPSINFNKASLSNQELDHISNFEKFKTLDKKEIFKDPEIQEESSIPFIILKLKSSL